MRPLRTIIVLTLASVPAIANAQEGRYDWPYPRPSLYYLTPKGDFNAKRAATKFWDAQGAWQRASKAHAQNELFTARTWLIDAKESRRAANLENTVQINLQRQLTKEMSTAHGPAELLASIKAGFVEWPAALQNGRAHELVTEAANLFSHDVNMTPQEQHRLKEIAVELRGAINAKKIGKSYDERFVAMRVVKAFELLNDPAAYLAMLSPAAGYPSDK